MKNSSLLPLGSIVFIILMMFSHWSCQPEQADFEGLWIGNHIKIDDGIYLPMLVAVNVTDSTAITTSLINNTLDTSTVKLIQDSLWVDTVGYGPSDYRIQSNSWQYRPPYNISLRRPEEADLDLNRFELRDALTGKTWKSPLGVLAFEEGHSALLLKPGVDAPDQLCWTIREMDRHLLLLLHGNHVDCEMYSYPIVQITAVGENSVVGSYTPGNETLEFSLEHVELELQPDDNRFQLCNPNLYINHPGHHYYYNGTDLYGGHYYINKQLDEKFLPKPNGFSGLVRIRFVVNCQGRTGMFEVKVMDPEYNVVEQNPDVTDQLLAITKGLGPWKPGGRSGQATDTYYYIVYKLKDGEVIDILP